MNELARIGKALSDENRITIITLLKAGKRCACDLLETCDCGQATLSHHMKILVEANLVMATKVGKWVYYELNKETFDSFIRFCTIEVKEMEGCTCQ